MHYDMLETCLLVPGISRSECASWVQAWGSIAAIVAAVWIAHRATKTGQRLAQDQATQMHLARERARVERHLEQLGPVLELFDAAVTELEHVRLLALSAHARDEWAVDPKELQQLKVIREALDEVPVHSMPTAATAGCFIRGRVLVRDASAQLDELVNLIGLAAQPSEEQDDVFRESVRLLQQERDRLHAALLRLIEPSAQPGPATARLG